MAACRYTRVDFFSSNSRRVGGSGGVISISTGSKSAKWVYERAVQCSRIQNTRVCQTKLTSGRLSYVTWARLCDVTPCPHPGTDTDGRCFRLNVGRTVLSSSTNTGELVEAELRIEGRRPGLGHATAGADTGRGISTCHDMPSRSANSVFTPANERRKSAHCAWNWEWKRVSRQSYAIRSLL